MTFRNFKITSLDTNESDQFFNLIDSNRERLEDFFAGIVSKTKTRHDTITYCREIEQKMLDKIYFLNK